MSQLEQSTSRVRSTIVRSTSANVGMRNSNMPAFALKQDTEAPSRWGHLSAYALCTPSCGRLGCRCKHFSNQIWTLSIGAASTAQPAFSYGPPCNSTEAAGRQVYAACWMSMVAIAMWIQQVHLCPPAHRRRAHSMPASSPTDHL